MTVLYVNRASNALSTWKNMTMGKMPFNISYTAVFVTCLVMLAGGVLIWNTQVRNQDFIESQFQLARTSVIGGSDLISQHIQTLRMSVQVMAERERFLVRELVKNPDNIDAYDALFMIIKSDMPQAIAILIADAHGNPYIEDFDGYILDICKQDIQYMAQKKGPPDLVIHPNPLAYHFDIMVEADVGLEDKVIFFVSFEPELLSAILARSHLFEHELLLVNNKVDNLIELNQFGARDGLAEENFYLSEQQRSDILFSSPVRNTKWSLVDIPTPQMFFNHSRGLWFETSTILLITILLSFYMVRLLSKSEFRLRAQNIALKHQADELSNANTLVQQERQEVLDLLERMNEGYFLIQEDWTILKVNSLGNKIFQESVQDLVGRDFWEIFPGLVSYYKNLNDSISNQTSCHFEGYYASTDRWFEFNSYPSTHGTALFIRDITERYMHELEIENTAQRLNAIFDSSVEGIITISESGKIESFNQAAEDIFGYSGNELLGSNISSLVHETHCDSNNFYVSNYSITRQGELLGKTTDLTGIRKDGSSVPLEFTLGEMKVQDQLMYTAILRDISARKQAESEAEASWQAKVNAESASNAKSAFLANMSHEIRTPLTAIIGFADSLLYSGQSKEERLSAIKTIIRSSNHLLELINDILDISKIEAGKIELEVDKMSLPDLVSEVKSITSQRASDKDLNFFVSLRTPVPSFIHSDYLRLKQILINLISNAVKFTDKGFIQLEIAYDQSKRQVQFDVIDTGIGIKAENVDKIFEKFTQADASTTRKFGGTGLGLPLSRQLAQFLGGDIFVNSEIHRGSIFSVVIDAGNVDKAPVVKTLDLPISQTIVQKTNLDIHLSGNILLVEDNQDNQRLISMYLEKMGAQITLADNGEIGVQKATQSSFDLIFMDMQMPVMDGLEATTLLREKGIKTPIVALTANALQEDRDRCLAAGCDDYMTKPISREKLATLAADYLQVLDETEIQARPIVSCLLEDEPEFADVVEKFVNSLPNNERRLGEAMDLQNWSDMKRIAHDIKGTAGSMGYPQLTDLAAQIEFQLINEDYDEVQLLCKDFHSMCQGIYNGLI